jgi:Zn-dependent peptidase ImmA (M78 family)
MRAYHFATSTDPKNDIVNFIRFTCNYLKIDSLPKIKFLSNPIQNVNANSFAAFAPDQNQIMLYAKNRHILDVFRSLAHELVHYKQSLSRSDLDGSTGSADENQANAIAGQIMRLYGKHHPELY